MMGGMDDTAPPGTGYCPVCRRDGQPVTADGMLREHTVDDPRDRVPGQPVNCEGAGQPVADEPTT